MKHGIACVMVVAVLAVSGFAADERPVPDSPDVAAKATTAENREQPPTSPLPAAPVHAANPAPAALPAAPSALIKLKQRPETHRFFDMKNTFALSAVAVSLTADALSTQKGLAQPGFYEMNPLARPFVQTRTGAAVYSAGSLGMVVGSMYLAHRTHHHKLERIMPFAVAGWEGLLSIRNYHVIALKTR
ncbi:MAG TPA: hypothetical protein VJW20_06655 [Candidatus Angelobacter sp.]|nr:hypothetical protein [Candidatus Angelobacter sp.]